VGLVQIADNLPLEKLSASGLEELVEFAKANSIAVEVGTKGIEEAHLLRLLEIAKMLSSPVLRVLPAFFGSAAVMKEVEACIRQVLPRFEKEGVIIVLENTEAFKAADYAALMERINHPCFKMCLDLANALGAMEGPEYVMDKLIPYVGNFHFKDVKVTRSETVMGFSVTGTPSGSGDLSLPWILEQLADKELHPSVIIELWPTFANTLSDTLVLEDAWVRESVSYMRSVMG
jgi:sugar phosphate isomerase/epimerase